jgi:DNA/RNA endonuclease YhcR with UshA esterase domain
MKVAALRVRGKENAMKTWLGVVLILTMMAALTPAFASPASAPSVAVPKYDPATEAVFKGTVQSVSDRQCPISGGMGSHVVLKLEDGSTIEVHLASTKFVKEYELVFAVGDQLEVTGSKVVFDGVETILAREVKRGNDVYVFRYKDGKPVW